MFDPSKHHRRSIRLAGYDYSTPGAYFLTICCDHRQMLLGEVHDSEMRLGAFGRVVESTWNALPDHYPNLELDAFQIMPNHVHGILWITGDGAVGAGPRSAQSDVGPVVGAGLRPAQSGVGPVVGAGLRPAPAKRHGLPEIVRAFKSFSARQINQLRRLTATPVWQRDYFEHIIRDEEALFSIRQYISTNPQRWENDIDNPDGLGDDVVEQWLAQFEGTKMTELKRAGLRPAPTSAPIAPLSPSPRNGAP